MNGNSAGTKRERHTTDSAGGSALGRALALSDEQSTLVVLQGDKLSSATAGLQQMPASFVGQFLVGQQSVCILLQHPDESLEQLHARVKDRLVSLESPPGRLLWIASSDAVGQRLLRLYSALTAHCSPAREVLLASGDDLMKVRPVASVPPCSNADWVKEDAVRTKTSVAPNRAQRNNAQYNGTQPIGAHPNGIQRVPSDPPHSAVTWSRPAEPDNTAGRRRRAVGRDDVD